MNSRKHLPFLDGLRALAALYVVLFHNWTDVFHTYGPNWQWPKGWGAATNFLGFGHTAVVVFIVLSGFCLQLGVREDFSASRFLWRRCIRIIPPYYAALAVSALVGVYLNRPGGKISMLEHLSLTDNWSNEHLFDFNIVLWTVALEFQIYLLFPALVWINRKVGTWLGCAVCCVLGYGLMVLLPQQHQPLNLIAMFGFGMLAARISQTLSLPEGWLRLATVCGLASVCLWLHFFDYLLTPLTDLVAGLTVSALLIWCYQYPHGLAAWLLSVPALVKVGLFSYSVYLIHFPVMLLTAEVTQSLHLTPTKHFAVRLALVPLSVVCAYGFYPIAELPFVRMKSSVPQPFRKSNYGATVIEA